MPSASLLQWRNHRMPRLGEIEAQCATSLMLTPPQPNLIEENLRGCVLLLSAHFQGFCRDLHTECGQVILSKLRPGLRLLIQRTSPPTGSSTTATRPSMPSGMISSDSASPLTWRLPTQPTRPASPTWAG